MSLASRASQKEVHLSPRTKMEEPIVRLPLILILSVGDGGSPAATAARHLSSVAAPSNRQA